MINPCFSNIFEPNCYKNMKKTFDLRVAIATTVFMMAMSLVSVQAQLIYRDNHIFVGDPPSNYATVATAASPGIYIGPDYSIESWDGGLNFWRPSNSTNYGNYKFFVGDDGNIGIGRKPTNYKLEVNGQVWITGDLLITSDGTLKKNIINIGDNRTEYVSKLLKLNGKLYDKQISSNADNAEEVKKMVTMGKIRKEDAATALKSLNKSRKDVYKKEFGFIAQEVKEQFPELVEENADGVYAMNYTGLIPVLLEAIKELNAKIDNLEKQLVSTKPNASTNSGSEAESGNVLETREYLSQNIPNPFNGTTTIKYNLPEGTTTAAITVYSTSGTVVKTIPLNVNNRSGSIALSSSEFSTGMYIYNLTANGAILDSKKMINQ
jgi:hypothetical protein